MTAAPETIWLPRRLTARLCVVAGEDKVATERKKEEEKGGGEQGDVYNGGVGGGKRPVSYGVTGRDRC